MNDLAWERVEGTESCTPVSPGVVGRPDASSAEGRVRNTPSAPGSPALEDGDGSMYYVVTVEERTFHYFMVKVRDADLAEHCKLEGIDIPQDRAKLAKHLAVDLAIDAVRVDEQVVDIREYTQLESPQIDGPYSSIEHVVEEFPEEFGV